MIYRFIHSHIRTSMKWMLACLLAVAVLKTLYAFVGQNSRPVSSTRYSGISLKNLRSLSRAIDNLSLTEEMVYRSVVERGDQTRISEIVLNKLLRSDPLNIYVIGGSLSAGGGIDDQKCNYPCLYSEYLKQFFNRLNLTKINVYNRAIGGVNSEYFAFCLNSHVNLSTADIIIGEIAVNDRLSFNHPGYASFGRPLDELVRQIKSLRHQPYLILTQLVDSYLLTKEANPCQVKYDSHEWIGICRYYNVTCISLLSAVCSLYQRTNGQDENYGFHKLISFDLFHASALSHRRLGYLIGRFITDGLNKYLENRPSTLASIHLDKIDLGLPPALYVASWITKPSCWTFSKHTNSNYAPFPLYAVDFKGFQYVQETNRQRKYRERGIYEHRVDKMVLFVSNTTLDYITIRLTVPQPQFATPKKWLKFAIVYISCTHCLKPGLLLAWIGTFNSVQSTKITIDLQNDTFGSVTSVLRGLKLMQFGSIDLTLQLLTNYEFKLHAVISAWDLRENL